ncbi:nSTAND1 domain-containing NTPase [Microcoleus sp. K5-D4]|uniref:nSTAND1 domain-containing NTPase n=1 Tax=Microcoleus sp. K5-D4 TaxID=2818801 RepID=UPI002FD57117
MSWSLDRTNFDRNIAVVIGINNYHHGIHRLKTAVNDATKLADILEEEYKYQEVIRLFPPHCEATLAQLQEILWEKLPKQLQPTEGDRLLFYFAGHGIARNSEEGPAGYLIPQDAQLGQLESFLPMRDLDKALSALDCHHLLVVLDCCFAGQFRWSKRNVIPVPETIHREHYDRYIRCSAWQSITSAAHNQEALDFLSDLREDSNNSDHSPFALALIEGLKDIKADLTGDGVITAPELSLYLRDCLVGKDGVELQTPQLWPLEKHGRGEFIFTLPGFQPENLKPAPELNPDNNPYRGLQSFEEKHARCFGGRTELVDELYQRICKFEPSSSKLIAVGGVSGYGKSSLVKAGLIPYMRNNHEKEWRILKPMRPGKSPFAALAKTVLPIANVLPDADREYLKQLFRETKDNHQGSIDLVMKWLVDIVTAWSKANPEVKLLLTIDQFEELITMSRKTIRVRSDAESESTREKPENWLFIVFRRDSKSKNPAPSPQKEEVREEWEQFVQLLAIALKNCPQLYIILTVRSDFKSLFDKSAFQEYWDLAHFPVRPMRSDELREAIEKPASEMALYFKPDNAVERLITQVSQTPGALPLLSFTLSQFYIKLYEAWQKDGKDDRALEINDEFYQRGIASSLSDRANKIYDDLPDDAKATMRRVMLRMVEIQGGVAVRRQIPESELVYRDDEENNRVHTVITSLVDARLIVKGKETEEAYYEPAHDFLVRGWDRLKNWQEQAQKTLPIEVKRRLTQAAVDYHNRINNQPQKTARRWNIDPRSSLLKQSGLWHDDPRLAQIEPMLPADAEQQCQEENKLRYCFRQIGKWIYHRILQPRIEITEEPHQLNRREIDFVIGSVNLRNENLGRVAGGLALIPVVLAVIIALIGIGLRNAQVGQIRSSRQAAEANLRSNQNLDALIEILRAGKIIKYSPLVNLSNPLALVNGDNPLKNQVKETLQKSVYAVRERNRLKHSKDATYVIVRFSPDGQRLATAGDDGTIALWNLQDKSAPKMLRHEGEIRSVDFSPKDELLATAGERGMVRLWNFQGQELNAWDARIGWIRSISFSRNGQLLATAGEKGTVIWNLQGQPLRQLTEQLRVWSVDFSPNGQFLATTGIDSTVRVWNLQGKELAKLERPLSPLRSVSFSPDGRLVAFTGDFEPVRLWDWQAKSVKESVKELNQGGRHWVVSFMSQNNNLLGIVGGGDVAKEQDSTISFFDWQSLKQLTEFPLVRLLIKHISFSPNGNLLATSRDDNLVQLWDLQGQHLVELKAAGNRAKSVSFSSNGQLLATTTDDGTIHWWNLQGEAIKDRKENLPSNNSCYFKDKDLQVKIGEQNTMANKAFLQNLQGENLAEISKGHDNGIKSISCTLDGKLLATTGSDGKVRLWDLQHQELKNQNQQFLKLVNEWSGEQGWIDRVQFSPDGKQLATGGDGSVRLWNLRGEPLATWKTGQGWIKSISFSPDGKLLATAGDKGNPKLWRIESFDELMERGCNWARDYLATLDEKNSDHHLCDGIGNSQQ